MIFSFIGYTSQEITVGANSVIDITLREGEQLSEVVVVGYGTQKKSDITGAISSVSTEDFEAQPVRSRNRAAVASSAQNLMTAM